MASLASTASHDAHLRRAVLRLLVVVAVLTLLAGVPVFLASRDPAPDAAAGGASDAATHPEAAATDAALDGAPPTGSGTPGPPPAASPTR